MPSFLRARRVAVVAGAAIVLAGACSDDAPLGDPPTAPTATVAPTTSTTRPATTTTAGPRLAAVAAAVRHVAGGLESPVAFAVREDDDRLFVAEQPGRVRTVRNGVVDGSPLLDLTDDVDDSGN